MMGVCGNRNSYKSVLYRQVEIFFLNVYNYYLIDLLIKVGNKNVPMYTYHKQLGQQNLTLSMVSLLILDVGNHIFFRAPSKLLIVVFRSYKHAAL